MYWCQPIFCYLVLSLEIEGDLWKGQLGYCISRCDSWAGVKATEGQGNGSALAC